MAGWLIEEGVVVLASRQRAGDKIWNGQELGWRARGRSCESEPEQKREATGTKNAHRIAQKDIQDKCRPEWESVKKGAGNLVSGLTTT